MIKDKLVMHSPKLSVVMLEAFKRLDGYEKLEAVTDRWIKVLDLIVIGGESNDKKVEQFCGGRNALLIPSALIQMQLASAYNDINTSI
jgi:hypothetical protein